MNLVEEIKKYATQEICSEEVYQRIQARLTEGNLTRDANSASHFCAYFFPYNPETKQVFIGYHKKADLWLSPGGHVDQGENLASTVVREIAEELGVKNLAENIKSELITITDINQDELPCKEHLDFWFFINTDGKDFIVDYTEYHEVRWVTIAEARKLIIDKQNLLALDTIEGKYFK